MTPALSLRDIAKTYRAGMRGCAARIDALRSVSFDVAPGELIGLLGPNGAGKSTLLLCLAGLLRPDRGTIAWFGETVRHPRPEGIAFVPERSAYYAFLTVREALEYYATLHELPPGDRRTRVAAAIERVQLGPHATKRVSQLSRGMIQRLGLAQALLARPRLLLLDETLSGLDPVARRDVRELLREMPGEGVTVVLSSHDMAALEQLATRVVVLVAGEVRAEFDPSALSGRRSLELRADAPSLAQRLLASRFSAMLLSDDRIRVPLDGVTPEEVLAHSRSLGIAVRTSRVVADDLEQRFFDLVEQPARVAEGGR